MQIAGDDEMKWPQRTEVQAEGSYAGYPGEMSSQRHGEASRERPVRLRCRPVSQGPDGWKEPDEALAVEYSGRDAKPKRHFSGERSGQKKGRNGSWGGHLISQGEPAAVGQRTLRICGQSVRSAPPVDSAPVPTKAGELRTTGAAWVVRRSPATGDRDAMES